MMTGMDEWENLLFWFFKETLNYAQNRVNGSN